MLDLASNETSPAVLCTDPLQQVRAFVLNTDRQALLVRTENSGHLVAYCQGLVWVPTPTADASRTATPCRSWT